MSNSPTESASLSESMLRLVESAPQVHRRYQFFLWSQGELQRWIPHRLMVCGAYDPRSREVALDVFNSLPMPAVALRGLQTARDVLMASAMNHWRQQRLQPCVLDLRQLPDDDVVSALRADGYGLLLVHGLTRPSRPDEIVSFFMFGSPDQSYDDGVMKALDMLLPCLHMTYQRVHATEMDLGATPLRGHGVCAPTPLSVGSRPLVTEREREILMWVRDGMSNQQISDKLGISALTVKNHVQKILRKLGAANRAQAVAKAMNMNILGAGQDAPLS